MDLFRLLLQMRAVIATVSLDDAIGSGRNRVEQRMQDLMQSILDDYHAGVRIRGVTLKQADPPAEVIEDDGHLGKTSCEIRHLRKLGVVAPALEEQSAFREFGKSRTEVIAHQKVLNFVCGVMTEGNIGRRMKAMSVANSAKVSSRGHE